MNKIFKYNIFTDNKNCVYAVSSFAGKTVRGVAKCNPNDTFDFESGKKLAIARCASKIATKRFKRACAKHDEAIRLYDAAVKYLHEMEEYEQRAKAELNDALFDEAEVKAEICNK